MLLQRTELQIFNLSNWRSIIDLDDKVYTLDLRWSERAQAWFISLYSNNAEQVIIDSLKLVLNIDMLKYAYSPLKPIGRLIAHSDNANIINFENFGVDIKLSYLTNI